MSAIRRRILAVLSAFILGFTLIGAGPLPARAATAGENAIAAKYTSMSSALGAATTPVYCGLVRDGCYQTYQYGTIVWSPATGAHLSTGAIRAKWAATGYERGYLGYPTTDEFCGLVRGGCYQMYEYGAAVLWSPATGAHVSTGAIRQKWASTGYERGFLGYPTSDEVCGGAQGGCYQMYEFGASAILWSPSTGAHWVWNAIRAKWANTGYERGSYGYPTTDEMCRTGTGGTLCRQDFQGGTIKWRSDVGIIDCTRQKCVALTFDGGPSAYTGQLLDTLDARNVQATFFVVGQYIDNNPAVVRRAATNGNEVMNHSWSHPCLIDNCPSAPNQGPISTTEIRSQLDRTSDKIQTTVGRRPTLMRPPFGEYDQRLLDVAGQEGLAVVNWSLDTIDWRDQNTAIVRSRAAQATPGSIILMHDTQPTTISAVPGIVSDLKAKGYVLVPVSDLIGKPVPGRFYTRQP